MSALLTNEVTPGWTSIPKCPHPDTSTPKAPKIRLKLNATIDKLNVMNDSAVSSLESESDSPSLFSSQE